MIFKSMALMLVGISVALSCQVPELAEHNYNTFTTKVLPRLTTNLKDWENVGQASLQAAEVRVNSLNLFPDLEQLLTSLEQTLALFKKMISLGRHPIVYPRDSQGVSLLSEEALLDPRTCREECVRECLDPAYNQLSKLYLVFHYCLVPECACSYIFEKEETPEYQQFSIFHIFRSLDSIIRRWDLSSYGSDGDLYTSEGLRIYQFSQSSSDVFLLHRNFDQSQQTWLESWHEETPETLVEEELAVLLPQQSELQSYQWLTPEAPSLQQCDLECAKDCLAVMSLFATESFAQRKAAKFLVDTCSAQRCHCYYSEVKKDPCNKECRMTCIQNDGPVSEMDQCMKEQCLCLDEKLLEEEVDEEMQELWEQVQQRILEDLDMEAQVVVFEATEDLSQPLGPIVEPPLDPQLPLEPPAQPIEEHEVEPLEDTLEQPLDQQPTEIDQEGQSIPEELPLDIIVVLDEEEEEDLINHLRMGVALYSESEVGFPLRHIPKDLALPVRIIVVLFSVVTLFMGGLFLLILRYDQTRLSPKKHSLRKRIRISLDEENRYAGKLSLLEKVEKKMFQEKTY